MGFGGGLQLSERHHVFNGDHGVLLGVVVERPSCLLGILGGLALFSFLQFKFFDHGFGHLGFHWRLEVEDGLLEKHGDIILMSGGKMFSAGAVVEDVVVFVDKAVHFWQFKSKSIIYYDLHHTFHQIKIIIRTDYLILMCN